MLGLNCMIKKERKQKSRLNRAKSSKTKQNKKPVAKFMRSDRFGFGVFCRAYSFAWLKEILQILDIL